MRSKCLVLGKGNQSETLEQSQAAFSLGVTGWLLSLEYEKFAELRTEYPFESLEGRIPPQPARHANSVGRLTDRAADAL